MLKENKLKVIISSVIILLPILFGIIMWNDLPNTMTTHWGADGNANGFSGKVFVVFGMPAIFLALHFITLIVTSLDKGQKSQTIKALNIIFWLIPVLSVFVSVVTYSVALDRDINLAMFIPMVLGLSFILMGNYMPKIKQNSTLGIKLPWALRNEENWNKTHRFGGKVMVAGGFITLLSAFLPNIGSIIVFVCVITAYAVAPTLYSYLLYKQHQKQGIEYAPRTKSKAEKKFAIISAVIVPIIFIGIAVLMFTGNIEVMCKDTSFEINASYWEDIDVEYTEIDTVEYREELDIGIRASGFGSARLSMGVFKNKEFGLYTLYAYTGAKEYIVLTSNEKTLVIGLKDTKDTRAIYDSILEKIGRNKNA